MSTGLRVMLCAAALLVMAPAFAEEHPDARSTSIDANPYHLDLGGLGALSTGSAEVLEHLELRVFVVGQHLTDPMGVMVDDEWERSLVDNRQQLDVGAAFGLAGRVEVGLMLPVVVHQKSEYPGQMLGPTADKGLGSLVFQPKVALIRQERAPLGLAVTLPLSFPTGDEDAYMGTGGFTFEPRLTVSRRSSAVTLAGSFGYLLQTRTDLLNIVEDDKLTVRAGIHVKPEAWRLGIALEYAGAVRASAPFQNRDETYGELDLGLQLYPGKGLSITGGAGTGIARGVPAPTFRAFVGLAWQIQFTSDRDHDGIAGAADACPREPEDVDGFEDADGCPDPDNDGDGIADGDDRCPDEAEDADGFEDTDGCPELDNDGDGVPDDSDACPEELEDGKGELPADGCPEPDQDGDGVPDSDDLCPEGMEDGVGSRPDDGCPEETKAILTETEILIVDVVLFDTDSVRLRPAAHYVLDQVLALLQKHPAVKIRLEGHCDDVGDAGHNLRLSQERADAVRDYLVGAGRPEDELRSRLETIGHGEAKPTGDNNTDAGRLLNRRVVFTVIR